MSAREVELTGGSPWGFRMHGGADVNQPLKISRVNPGRKAALSGIREGDLISSINNVPTKNMTNAEAHAMLKNSGNVLKLGLNEDTGSPRRRSGSKSNGVDLKRPSQLLAEMQVSKSTPQPMTSSQLTQINQPQICTSQSTYPTPATTHTSPSLKPTKTDNTQTPKTSTIPQTSATYRTTNHITVLPSKPAFATEYVTNLLSNSIPVSSGLTPSTVAPSTNHFYKNGHIGSHSKIPTSTLSYATTPKLSVPSSPFNPADTKQTSPRSPLSSTSETKQLSPRSPLSSVSQLIGGSQLLSSISQKYSPVSTQPSILPTTTHSPIFTNSTASSIFSTITTNITQPHPIPHMPVIIPPPINSSPFIPNSSPFSDITAATTTTQLSPFSTTIPKSTSPFSTSHLPEVQKEAAKSPSANDSSSFSVPYVMNSKSPFSTSYFPTSEPSSTSTAHSSYFADSLVYTKPKSTNPFLTEYTTTTNTEITEHNITETEEITTTKKFSLSNDNDKDNIFKINGVCSGKHFIFIINKKLCRTLQKF